MYAFAMQLFREWPTWLLIVVIYGSFGLLTYNWDALVWPLMMVLAGYVLAWHASLQHELIHGHPSPFDGLNTFLGFWPLLIWLPYLCFKRTHIEHHRCSELANPVHDPESLYVVPEYWASAGPFERTMHRINFTLAGRMIVGPWMVVCAEIIASFKAVMNLDRVKLKSLLIHYCTLIPVLYWLLGVCQIPLWYYLVVFVWPGTALLLLRSYLEHRPESDNNRRTAIVESGALLNLLFLNNNYHVIHHAEPGLAWYDVKSAFDARPEHWLSMNGGYYYAGYSKVFRMFVFNIKDGPNYPK